MRARVPVSSPHQRSRLAARGTAAAPVCLARAPRRAQSFRSSEAALSRRRPAYQAAGAARGLRPCSSIFPASASPPWHALTACTLGSPSSARGKWHRAPARRCCAVGSAVSAALVLQLSSIGSARQCQCGASAGRPRSQSNSAPRCRRGARAAAAAAAASVAREALPRSARGRRRRSALPVRGSVGGGRAGARARAREPRAPRCRRGARAAAAAASAAREALPRSARGRRAAVLLRGPRGWGEARLQARPARRAPRR